MASKSEILSNDSSLSTKEIAIVVILEVKRGMTKKFENVIEENIRKSRAEEGVLEFKLFKIDNRENHYALVERYADQDAIDHHMTLPQAKNMFEVFDKVLTKKPDELINFGTELFSDRI